MFSFAVKSLQENKTILIIKRDHRNKRPAYTSMYRVLLSYPDKMECTDIGNILSSILSSNSDWLHVY